MPECLTVRHPISPVPERKTNDAGTDLVSNQADAVWHFFLVWYWTEIMDAGMLMLAIFSSMPMPSYDRYINTRCIYIYIYIYIIYIYIYKYGAILNRNVLVQDGTHMPTLPRRFSLIRLPFSHCVKEKFVVCPHVYEETNRSYPFSNGLNGLNGLAGSISSSFM